MLTNYHDIMSIEIKIIPRILLSYSLIELYNGWVEQMNHWWKSGIRTYYSIARW